MKNKGIILCVGFMLCLSNSLTLADKKLADYELEQAIDYAVRKGNINEVKQLLSAGASADTFYIGYPVLWWAVDKNYIDIVKLLIESGANVNKPSQSGKMPLMIAADNRKVDIVKILLNAGADTNLVDKSSHRTALDYALNSTNTKATHVPNEIRKRKEIAKLLIENGADINATNRDGTTILMTACLVEDLKFIKNLHKAGAEIHKITDNGSALNYAAMRGEPEIINYLVDNGLKLETKNYFGETPLLLAAKRARIDGIKELVKLGADVSALNNKGESALHLVAKRYDVFGDMPIVPMINLLIKFGVNPNIRAENDTHFTALIRAAQKGYSDRVEALLEGGAKVDLHSGLGDTALMWAAQNGHVETVKVLLAHGADPNRPGFGGITPLDHAKEHEEIRELLINAGASQSGMDKLKAFLKNLFN